MKLESEVAGVTAEHPSAGLNITPAEYDALIEQEGMTHEGIVEALDRVGMSPLQFEEHLQKIAIEDTRPVRYTNRAARRAAQRAGRK